MQIEEIIKYDSLDTIFIYSFFPLQPYTCYKTLSRWDWKQWGEIERAWKLWRLRSQQSFKQRLSQDFKISKDDKNDDQQWWYKRTATFSFGVKGCEQIWPDVVPRFEKINRLGVFAFQPINCSCYAHPWCQEEHSQTGSLLVYSQTLKHKHKQSNTLKQVIPWYTLDSGRTLKMFAPYPSKVIFFISR